MNCARELSGLGHARKGLFGMDPSTESINLLAVCLGNKLLLLWLHCWSLSSVFLFSGIFDGGDSSGVSNIIVTLTFYNNGPKICA